ncbi:MAG: exodeoxyribonuclease VII large subunit [Pseudomonadales bacterium]
MNSQPSKDILSVSQLNRQARMLLETHLSETWVCGEISNFSQPSSGHWYFTLKDKGAQVRCAMFKGRNRLLKFTPEAGMQIVVRARLSLYEARGDYQLIVEHMEPEGVGALQQAFEQLKAELAGAGWFSAEYKKPLPTMPAHIGVVTSASGAALHDILTVSRRRFPSTAITVFPTTVQGTQAEHEIAQAIRTANALSSQLSPPLEALIVGRGGGSLEDLWCFNTRTVASAIRESELPIVSAVGHEVDFSIADFVADARAATPSAAAELLTPEQSQLKAKFISRRQQLEQTLQRLLNKEQRALQQLSKRLKHPGQRIREQAQRLDELELRIQRSFNQQLERRRQQLGNATHRLFHSHPEKQIAPAREKLQAISLRNNRAFNTQLNKHKAKMENLAGQLHAVSPLATLGRGYAIVRDKEMNIISSKDKVEAGQDINITVTDGDFTATVS